MSQEAGVAGTCTWNKVPGWGFWCLLLHFGSSWALCHFAGALLDPLVMPLHFWWILVGPPIWLFDWGKPVVVSPVFVVGCCGGWSLWHFYLLILKDGPWALLFSFDSWSIEDGVFLCCPSLRDNDCCLWLCSHIVCFGVVRIFLGTFFGGDWFIQIIWKHSPWGFVVSLIEVCCFIRCLILLGNFKVLFFSLGFFDVRALLFYTMGPASGPVGYQFQNVIGLILFKTETPCPFQYEGTLIWRKNQIYFMCGVLCYLLA